MTKQLKVDNIVNVAGTGKPNFPVSPTSGGAALSTLNHYSYISSATEPSSPKNGAIWWDSANSKVYVYANGEFKEVTLNTDYPSAYSNQNPWSGDRGIVAGGETDTISRSNVIQYFDITTAGNAQDFGDMATARELHCGASSSARGLSFGGYGVSSYLNIEYITISTTGNGTSFGDLNTGATYNSACSDGTKAFTNGGYPGPINEIQYVTIATTGNAADWGDLVGTSWLAGGSAADTTRAVHYAGHRSSYSNAIDYYSTASAGNASDFGNGTQARGQGGGASDATRAIFAGGTADGGSDGGLASIDYLTIQTTANAQDFGDLTQQRFRTQACPNFTRAAIAGGIVSSRYNIIEYVTIQTTGNATDLGDLAENTTNHVSFSGNPS